MVKAIALAIVSSLALAAGFGLYQLAEPQFQTWAGQGRHPSPAAAKARYREKQKRRAPPAAKHVIDFNLPDLSGKKRDMTDWRGKLLLLNFWAPWCAPCRDEIPLLESLQNQYGRQGLQIIGLALDRPEAVRAYATHVDINYPVLLGEKKITNLGAAYGNTPQALPFSVLIDRRGKVVKRQRGELERAQALEWVRSHLRGQSG